MVDWEAREAWELMESDRERFCGVRDLGNELKFEFDEKDIVLAVSARGLTCSSIAFPISNLVSKIISISLASCWGGGGVTIMESALQLVSTLYDANRYKEMNTSVKISSKCWTRDCTLSTANSACCIFAYV